MTIPLMSMNNIDFLYLIFNLEKGVDLQTMFVALFQYIHLASDHRCVLCLVEITKAYDW